MITEELNKSFFRFRVEGLKPDMTYPTHVHERSCDDQKGGGHYKTDIEVKEVL